MTKDLKKKLPIVISGVVLLTVICILMSVIANNKENKIVLKTLEDDYKYFTLQNVVNEQFTSDYETTSFTATKIEYKEIDDMIYYFVQGYTIKYSELENVYTDNINYLVSTIGNFYEIEQITISDIELYKEQYYGGKTITENKILPIIEFNEESKLMSYIANFNNLLMFDETKAKAYIKGNITSYDNLSTQIQAYEKEGNTYTVRDSNNNRFKITENSVMNYVIE